MARLPIRRGCTSDRPLYVSAPSDNRQLASKSVADMSLGQEALLLSPSLPSAGSLQKVKHRFDDNDGNEAHAQHANHGVGGV